MINPSANGWIDKFFTQLKNKLPVQSGSHEFYRSVRDSGFIYGHVVSFNNLEAKETKGWTTEEMTKAAMLNTLYDLYRFIEKKEEPKEFINKTILFYKAMATEGAGFLKKVLPASTASHELEEILDERVKTNDNIISRNFSHILTNA